MILLVGAGCADDQPPTPRPTAVAARSIASDTLPLADDGLDLVFQGGGAKGLAHIGAIKELERQGRSYRRVVGTSAGSIVAVLLAAGFSADEMRAIITQRTPEGYIITGSFLEPPGEDAFRSEELRQSITFLTLQDIIPDFVPQATAERIELDTLANLLQEPHFRGLFSLVEAGGLYSGEELVAWLREVLDAGGRGLGDATLAEFHAATGVDMTIVVTNADKKEMMMLNQRTAPNVPIVWAVRMSSSIPFVFQEVVWRPEWGSYIGEDISGDYVVDGGLTSNFPMELVVSREVDILAGMGQAPRPATVLGLVLDHETEVPGLEVLPTSTPATAGDALENERLADRWRQIGSRTVNLIDTFMNGTDNRIAATYPEHVCHLPVQGVDTLQYDLSEEAIDHLLAAAEETTRTCLVNLDK